MDDGCIILALMVASDQTNISNSQQDNAWPIYLTLGKYHIKWQLYLRGRYLGKLIDKLLGNIPMEYRAKDQYKGNRLLSYLPVIESIRYRNQAWFRQAKQAIFHYCLEVIFEPFAKEGYDQNALYIRASD